MMVGMGCVSVTARNEDLCGFQTASFHSDHILLSLWEQKINKRKV